MKFYDDVTTSDYYIQHAPKLQKISSYTMHQHCKRSVHTPCTKTAKDEFLIGPLLHPYRKHNIKVVVTVAL